MGALRQLLLSLDGRVPRSTFWIFTLIGIVASLAYMLFVARKLGVSLKELGTLVAGAGVHSPQGRKAIFLMLPWWTAWLIPGVALGVKRLHDRNRSGWWLLLLVYGPWVSDFVVNASGTFSGVKWLGFAYRAIVLAINLWGLVELGFLRGTEGRNPYGPDPLLRASAAST